MIRPEFVDSVLSSYLLRRNVECLSPHIDDLIPGSKQTMTVRSYSYKWSAHVSHLSTHGTMKKTPGPLAPPLTSRPSRKMTALSNSWTTLTTRRRERGRVTRIRRREMTVRSLEQSTGPPLSQSWFVKVDVTNDNIFSLSLGLSFPCLL